MTKFKKGMIPWNKGKKTGLVPKSAFKAGHVPWTHEVAGTGILQPWNKGLKGFQAGSNHWNWKGGKQKNGNGYMSVVNPDHHFADRRGRVLEHRLVMEEKLGRLLMPNEVVDHINGIRDDNRPENLQLFSSNAEHLKEEAKRGTFIKWRTHNG